MLVATFGPTTGWSGKTITFKKGTFVLQDHGPISASDVMQYDQRGHLVWANDKTRAWVKAKTPNPKPTGVSIETIATERSMRFARRVLKWNAWFFAVGGASLLVVPVAGIITAFNVHFVTVAIPGLLWAVPGAVILINRPARATVVRRWLSATSVGDIGWAIFFVEFLSRSYYGGLTADLLMSVLVAFAVFGFLSVRGVLAMGKGIDLGLEPWSVGSKGLPPDEVEQTRRRVPADRRRT